MVELGRLPGITLWATSSGGVPSAAISAAVRPKGQGCALGEAAGHQQVVLVADLMGRRAEGDEVGGDQLGSLVDQLVEGVLAVGAGLAPEDLAGLELHAATVEADRLPVGFHRQLL